MLVRMINREDPDQTKKLICAVRLGLVTSVQNLQQSVILKEGIMGNINFV